MRTCWRNGRRYGGCAEDPATEEQLERELAEANDELPFGFRRAAEKVRSFPRKPACI